MSDKWDDFKIKPLTDGEITVKVSDEWLTLEEFVCYTVDNWEKLPENSPVQVSIKRAFARNRFCRWAMEIAVKIGHDLELFQKKPAITRNIANAAWKRFYVAAKKIEEYHKKQNKQLR
jgi:hypothetical protein